MNRVKWLARAGSLIVLVGFFLPYVIVPQTGNGGPSQSLSLYDLARSYNQYALYLLLVGALAALAVAFVTAVRPQQALLYRYIQLGAMVAGILVSLVSLAALLKQQTYDITQVKPDYGLLVLLVGLIVFLAGWFIEWQGLTRSETVGIAQPASATFEPFPIAPPSYPPPNMPPQPASSYGAEETFDWEEEDEVGTSFPGAGGPATGGARLEQTEHGRVVHTIPVTGDDFTIGRGSDMQLRLKDSTVSRHHARLRLANGAWFIQDTDSTGGLYVNEKKVPAIRLNSGDEIKIGEQTFIFYC